MADKIVLNDEDALDSIPSTDIENNEEENPIVPPSGENTETDNETEEDGEGNSSSTDIPENPGGEEEGEEIPEPTPPEEDPGADYQGTRFALVYNRFLEKITDDMYMEMTPEDTIRDLRNLLTEAIPGFEFPRVCLDDYYIGETVINQADAKPGDFILAILWEELSEDGQDTVSKVLVEHSRFKANLSSEEINILALLMKQGWVQRQVSSIEVTRMKFSGSDFKMTSQANHLGKLLSLLDEARRDSFHMQRLYKRRKKDSDGVYRSNWGSIMEKRVFR